MNSIYVVVIGYMSENPGTDIYLSSSENDYDDHHQRLHFLRFLPSHIPSHPLQTYLLDELPMQIQFLRPKEDRN